MKFDVHNHAIPETALELLRSDPSYGVALTGRRWRGGVHVDFDVVPSFVEPAAKLNELEAKGLDAAVISVAPMLFYYHVGEEAGERMAVASNQGLAAFCAAQPDRLAWLASVPMQAPERATAVLRDAVAAGCVGVEVGTGVAGRRLDEDDFEPFWSTAAELDLPVTLHPAYTEGVNPALAPFYLENVLGYPFDTTIAIERLICAGVLDRHPQLKIVLVHAGGYFPYQVGRLRHAVTVRNELSDAPDDPLRHLDRVFFDIITHDPLALEFLIRRVGQHQVVMGTDLPFDMAPPEPMELLRAAANDDVVHAITETNVSAIYGL